MLENGIEAFPLAEQMAVFFMLQRYLFKWGGEYEARNDCYWQLFRTLFLTVCNQPAPATYQSSAYVEQWERDYLPNLAEYQQTVTKSI